MGVRPFFVVLPALAYGSHCFMTPTDMDVYRSLVQADGGKIVMLILDGLGGLPVHPHGVTELEHARTPNLDRLVQEGMTGLSVPVRTGIEPGSGPAHLALFGYDPVTHAIGRGVLEALGIDFRLTPLDMAARGNFATADAAGVIVDRRAGRIPTAECQRITALLQQATGDCLPGYEVFVRPVKEYRFVLVLRGAGLGGQLTDTDPGATGLKPLPVTDTSGTAAGQKTAALFNRWLDTARNVIREEPVANTLNLRGLAMDPGLPAFPDVFGLQAAAIAVYPMYRGVARLVGMEPVDFAGKTPADQVRALRHAWSAYDFFFVHVKKTDSYGEDGNFAAKVGVIEEVDAVIPDLMALQPDVLIVTGDHSTPVALRSHSWHPVPALLWSPTVRPDQTRHFGERDCATGSMGLFPATSLMPQAMAHAGRFKRFGA